MTGRPAADRTPAASTRQEKIGEAVPLAEEEKEQQQVRGGGGSSRRGGAAAGVAASCRRKGTGGDWGMRDANAIGDRVSP